ncbi:uncharacterized protein LOC131246343 isoform X2 [Magnolia sinica]|uniref:uncharacterized protein LOC131246343 isoform X2 n=1 Tax=Magnolia sinica TaxID=86752 RepID=UPI002659BDAF|nr:uncharacterized protein LOC131246343 isoform X2 [Magnolia sinica]
MMAADRDPSTQDRCEEINEIVPAIKENQEMARNDPDSASGAGNREIEMESFSEARNLGECKSSQRRYEEGLGNFSANGEKSESVSEDMKIWSEHQSDVEGKQDSVENESESVYEIQNSRGCDERYDEFEAVEERLKSVYTEERKSESDCEIQRSRRCEERSGNFEEIGEKLESHFQNAIKWSETLLQVEGKQDPVGSNSERGKKFSENGENSESVSEDEAKFSKNHLEAGRRQDMVENELESVYEIQDSRGCKEISKKFETIEEKLVSISEDANTWLGNPLEVEGKQDAVEKERSLSFLITQDSRCCKERYRNFSDVGENSNPVSKDAMKWSENQLEFEGKQDAVEKHSKDVYETGDSRRCEENCMNFSVIDENQETNIKMLGLDSKVLNLGKRIGSWSSKKKLGGLTVIKEKQDTEETGLGPVLEAQKDGEKISQDEMKSVSEDEYSLKEDSSRRCEANSEDFLKINGFSGSLEIKVDSVSKSQNAVVKPYYWQESKKCPLYIKEVQEMTHHAENFYNNERKQVMLGTYPASSSRAGNDNGKNEKGSTVSGRSAERSFYRNSKQGTVEKTVKCRGRKGMINGSEMDGKLNGMWFVPRLQTVYEEKGKRPKRCYSRSELQALRYMNGEEQNKIWNEIYQGLAPVVAWELDQIAAYKNQKQGLRNADRRPVVAREFDQIAAYKNQKQGHRNADRPVVVAQELDQIAVYKNQKQGHRNADRLPVVTRELDQICVYKNQKQGHRNHARLLVAAQELDQITAYKNQKQGHRNADRPPVAAQELDQIAAYKNQKQGHRNADRPPVVTRELDQITAYKNQKQGHSNADRPPVAAHELDQITAYKNQKQGHRNADRPPHFRKKRDARANLGEEVAKGKGNACKWVCSEEWLKVNSPTHSCDVLVRNW